MSTHVMQRLWLKEMNTTNRVRILDDAVCAFLYTNALEKKILFLQLWAMSK